MLKIGVLIDELPTNIFQGALTSLLPPHEATSVADSAAFRTSRQLNATMALQGGGSG